MRTLSLQENEAIVHKMTSAFLVSPISSDIAFKISRGEKGSKDNGFDCRIHFMCFISWQKRLSAGTMGSPEKGSLVSGLGNQRFVIQRSEIRTTEGSEEEAILRQNNEYRLRDTKLKILVSQHGGDVGRQFS